MAARIVARLRFHRMDSLVLGSEERGEAVLYADRTVRLRAGKGLRKRLMVVSERMDRGALLYGASAFMAIAAVGAALVVKRKPVAGFAALALAGLTALGASGVRVAAKRIPALFETPIAAETFVAEVDARGILTLSVVGVVWSGAVLRFSAGEYDPQEAEAFLAALPGPA